MVIAMKMRGSNLHSCSKHQPEPVFGILTKFDLAHYQSRSQESLILPIVRTAVIVAGVCFKLRPEVLTHFVLGNRVP